MRQDPDLEQIAAQMEAAGDVELGGTTGTVRARTRTDDDTIKFQALEIEHRTRLSDNPWRYNDPDNLILSDSAQNQQFLEALRRFGNIWPTDDLEDFIVRNALTDQPTTGAPGTNQP